MSELVEIEQSLHDFSISDSAEETPDRTATEQQFVYQTMLTCIGNKRKLIPHIRQIVSEIADKLSKPRLNIVDAFSGSAVVSRALSFHSEKLHSNDLELYAYQMAHCYLKTPTEDDQIQIRHHITQMNRLAETGPYVEGIVCRLYAPKKTDNVEPGERCFYTRENALILDTLRRYIEESVEPHLTTYCLVPLLNRASIHTNTAGVFKGFYKNEGIGCFGGSGRNALSRIMGPIRLDVPVWNNSGSFEAVCHNRDIVELVDELPQDIDLMYLDPPYNQHPYGSNYFMLNVISTNECPTEISRVSGIPTCWNKSAFNKRKSAFDSMQKLLRIGTEKSKYILLSYNNEGILETDDWKQLLEPYDAQKREIVYDTYKGSRNLKSRENKVVEIMYIIKKK